MLDQDESWFSRFKQTAFQQWAGPDDQPRLLPREPARHQKDKAIACFGAVCQQTGQRYFYICDGQPNSDKTILMLKRLLAVARDKGKRVLLILWDRASWHKSKALFRWIRAHNRQAKRNGDVRLLTCLLPSKSPWLNSMEPHWVHAKRKVGEADGRLSLPMLKRRLSALFQVPLIEAYLK